MARAIESPDGERWKVGRQWAPWRPRLRRRRRDAEDAAGEGIGGTIEGIFAADDFFAGLLIGVLGFVVFVLAFVVVWPVIAIAAEIVIVVLGVLGATVGRVVLRRPWVIRAWEPDSYHEHVWRVTGWRSSRQMIDAVSSALERGQPLPPPRAGDDALSR